MRYLVVLWLISFSSIAMQKITLQEGIAANVPVAVGKLNQIFVQDDRIKSLKSIDKQLFSHDKDVSLGQLYITPNQTDKNIHIFLTTENNKNISLNLLPAKIEPQMIELGFVNKEPNNIQQSAYDEQISELIIGMHNDNDVTGFKTSRNKTTLPKTINKLLPQALKIKTIKTYKGKSFTGFVLEARNTKEPVLNLHDYLAESVAYACTYSRLGLNSKAHIYLVTANA